MHVDFYWNGIPFALSLRICFYSFKKVYRVLLALEYWLKFVVVINFNTVSIIIVINNIFIIVLSLSLKLIFNLHNRRYNDSCLWNVFFSIYNIYILSCRYCDIFGFNDSKILIKDKILENFFDFLIWIRSCLYLCIICCKDLKIPERILK